MVALPEILKITFDVTPTTLDYTKLHLPHLLHKTPPNYTYYHQRSLGGLKNTEFLSIPPRLAVNVQMPAPCIYKQLLMSI